MASAEEAARALEERIGGVGKPRGSNNCIGQGSLKRTGVPQFVEAVPVAQEAPPQIPVGSGISRH